jgi:hypothetical protein
MAGLRKVTEFEARGLKLVEEGGGHSTTTYSEYDYVEGTLVCDIYDKAKEQLVWEGIGTGTINQNPKNRDQSIPEAVKLIMAKYPVAPITE